MRLRDLPGWPPRWSGNYRGGLVWTPQGEIGVLRAAAADVAEGQIVLAIEYDGEVATGILRVRADLLEGVARLLRAQTGRPIAEISDLEISEERLGPG